MHDSIFPTELKIESQSLIDSLVHANALQFMQGCAKRPETNRLEKNDTQLCHCKHLHLDVSRFGLSFAEIFHYVCFKQMDVLIKRG